MYNTRGQQSVGSGGFLFKTLSQRDSEKNPFLPSGPPGSPLGGLFSKSLLHPFTCFNTSEVLRNPPPVNPENEPTACRGMGAQPFKGIPRGPLSQEFFAESLQHIYLERVFRQVVGFPSTCTR